MNKLVFTKLPVLLAAVLLLNSCVIVVPVTVFLQNTTTQPVQARLHYREWVRPGDTTHSRYHTIFSRGLRYSPRLLKPSRRVAQSLTATLPVSATDTAAMFIIPPHATALLVSTYSNRYFMLPADAKLYLQPAGGAVQVLDAESFQQAAHFRRGTFCYTIGPPTP
jgi:hypothetical protein